MIAYVDKSKELRRELDAFINRQNFRDLSAPELVKKALMIEKQMLAK